MVHETENHHKSGEGWVASAYLWVELVNKLNGILDLALVDSIADVDAFANAGRGLFRIADVGLLGELLGGTGIAFRNEIVHDDPVDVTVSRLVSREILKASSKAAAPGLLLDD